MYKNIKNKRNTILKLNTTLLMLIIIGVIFNYDVFAYTRGELKGGISNFPCFQSDNIEILLSTKGYEKPEFNIRVIRADGELMFLTNGYESFPDKDGSFIVKFEQKYSLKDKQIEIRSRDKNDKKKENILYLDVKVNVKTEKENNGEYNINLKRNGIRYQLYDRNGIITDDEKINKDLLEYISNPEVFKGDEIRFKSYPGEKYKLHVYDIEKSEWIIDEDDYRHEIIWSASDSGRYILDLWIKNKDNENKYDRWILKPLNVKERAKPVINLFFTGTQPLEEDDEFSFFINTNTKNQVQYKAWIINSNDERTEVTNGYTEFINGEEFYKFEYDKALEPGVYKLWIWTRVIGDDSYRTSYEGREFLILDKNQIVDIKTTGEIEFNKSIFYEKEVIRVYGMHDLETPENDYVYKMDIFDVKKNEWIYYSEKYDDYPTWTPKGAGAYIVSLKIKERHDVENRYRRILRPIEVMVNTDDLLVKQKKYTIVNTFNELKYAVANDFIFIINNEKVKEAYKEAIKVKREVIDKGNTTLEKLMLINEYIVTNTKYDTRLFENEYIDDESISIYGTLINGVSICQGYSDTTKLFLDMLGIDNRVVEGEVKSENRTLSHIWNVVTLDGKEYYIDTTFNDPIPDKAGRVNYSTFLANDEAIKSSHEWNNSKYGNIKNDEFSYFSEMVAPLKEDGWIYYLNKKDRMRLYKIKIDGTKKVKISNEIIGEFIIDKEWIFFTSKYGGHIYRINKEGLGPLKLNNEPSINIEEEDGWIKYRNFYDKKYYIINKDGTKKFLYRELDKKNNQK